MVSALIFADDFEPSADLVYILRHDVFDSNVFGEKKKFIQL